MRQAIIAAGMAAALAPATGAAQGNAAEDIAPGRYVWTTESGCGTLTAGDAFAYVWDRGCDGNVDYEGDNVWARGSVVYIDRATFSLRSVTEDRLTGVWKLNDYSADIAFERR